MLKFSIPGKPIPQSRPRFAKNGQVFDKQKKEKEFCRLLIKSQMANKRILKPVKGVLFADMIFYTPIPNSWPQKQKKAVSEISTPDPTRCDCDNLQKFYLDCMNNLIYEDDRQVTDLYAKKRYSPSPRTEIIIYTQDDMIEEHAITSRKEDSVDLEELSYMIKKANRIGLNDRKIIKITKIKDREGTHYFFECEPLKPTIHNCS